MELLGIISHSFFRTNGCHKPSQPYNPVSQGSQLITLAGPPSPRGSQQPSHCQELASPEGRRKHPPAPSNSRWNQHAFRNKFHAETDIRKSSDGINSRHTSLPPVILVTSAEDGDKLPTIPSRTILPSDFSSTDPSSRAQKQNKNTSKMK